MKKLSEVTLEDAIAILQPVYPGFFSRGKWILEDRSEEIGEPHKFLFSKTKSFSFWFADDEIEVCTPDADTLNQHVYDVKYRCYINAHEKGYYVPVLSDYILNRIY